MQNFIIGFIIGVTAFAVFTGVIILFCTKDSEDSSDPSMYD